MSKVAVMGDKTSVLGFKALGVDTYPLERPEDGREMWSQISEQDYGIIFVTEPVYRVMEDIFVEVSEEIAPAITIIPATTGATGLGMERIRKTIEKAVGADILSEKEE
jgi:V/A-type H+-transporting ATPase subunit F